MSNREQTIIQYCEDKFKRLHKRPATCAADFVKVNEYERDYYNVHRFRS